MNSHKVWGFTAIALATTLVPTFAGAAPLAKSPSLADPITLRVATSSAQDLLRDTLNRYGAFTSYNTQGTREETVSVGGKAESDSETFTLNYASPNKLRLVEVSPKRTRTGEIDGTATSTQISDGIKVLRYTDETGPKAQEEVAPSNVGLISGLTLLQALGDVKSRARLVPANTPVMDKPGVTVNGVSCRVISFMTTGNRGNVELAIGRNDGLIHRINYDYATLLAKSKGLKGVPDSITVSETYDAPQVNSNIVPTQFSATLPAGTTLDPSTVPPVPIGQKVPDFTVPALSGTQQVQLSSLRGQVVLLDFWATWCPPCRESLPETQQLNTTYGNKDLKVLAISNEKAAKVVPFIEQNKYTFPVFLDGEQAAGKAFNIAAFPTFVVIDKEGKLAAFLLGLHEPGYIEEMLEKAGVDTK